VRLKLVEGDVIAADNTGFRRTLVRLKHRSDDHIGQVRYKFQTNSREVEALPVVYLCAPRFVSDELS